MNNLRTPESVGTLRQTVQANAKGHPSDRFYRLYDKVSRRGVLVYAWARGRRNGGGAGVDGQTFEEIEAVGVEKWRDDVAEPLLLKTDRPEAVRRVYSPNEGGTQRPRGIPTIKDRVGQMAAVIGLDPIVEVDLMEEP